MDNFEGLNIFISTFCGWADGFQGLSKIFTTLFTIPFPVTGQCSLLPKPHWLQGKCAIINLSQAANGMILQNQC